MSVGKIFKILVVIVACVIVGALVLNVLLPNVSTSLVNAVEGQIFNATGMSFDFNGDGNSGKTTAANARTGQDIQGANGSVNNNADQNQQQSGGVNGFN